MGPATPSTIRVTGRNRMTQRQQKITLGEMRQSGVRGVLIYCADYKCLHWIAVNADQCSGNVAP